MQKSWRWPLLGFLLGGLVGATILTVNVVGASSPAPDGVTVSSFGEILHTPPQLAEAGQPVDLGYDVVCGPTKDEPGEACSPKGSVFVRVSGTGEFVEHRLERERKVLDAIAAGASTDDEILERAWDDAPIDSVPVLRVAAAATLQAHLEKLRDEGRLPS